MALLAIEGFDQYIVYTLIPLGGIVTYTTGGSYTNLTSWYPAPGYISGNAFNWNKSDNTAQYIQSNLFSNKTTMVCGLAFNIALIEIGYTTATAPIIEFLDQNNAVQGGILLNTNTDYIQAYTNVTSNIVATSTKPINLRYGNWNYIECKYVCDSFSGSIEVRVNNEVYLLIENINTNPKNNGYVARTRHYKMFTSIYYDDFYWLDNTGNDHVTFLGPCHISSPLPSADGRLKEFDTTGVSPNYYHYSEVSDENDSTFVTSTSTNQYDLYKSQSLSYYLFDSIIGVMLQSRALGTIGDGSESISHVISNLDGSSVFTLTPTSSVLTASYNTQVSIFEITASGLQITPSTFNNYEIGVKS
jgi:hypothetical protein